MHKLVHFRQIIEKLKKTTGLNQKQIAVQVFDISDNNLSNRIRENRIDFQKLICWAINNKVNLDWLLIDNDSLTSNNVIPIHPGYELADMVLERTKEKIDTEGKKRLAEALRKIYDKRTAKIKESIIDEIGSDLVEILKLKT